MADLAGVRSGQRVLDVGCGPGALTAELVSRVGPAAVSAVDPSEPFVAAARDRNPGVDVLQASAEHLPFPDGTFDAALAQLVVHFMADPVAGLTEMARVTRPDGVVAACVWDHAGGQGPLGLFWRAARELDPEVHDESRLAGAREGHLAELFEAAGLREIEETTLSASLEHPSFEEWWEPYTRGVGPAGAYVAGLDPARPAAAARSVPPPAPCRPVRAHGAGVGSSRGRVGDEAHPARGSGDGRPGGRPLSGGREEGGQSRLVARDRAGRQHDKDQEYEHAAAQADPNRRFAGDADKQAEHGRQHPADHRGDEPDHPAGRRQAVQMTPIPLAEGLP